MKSAIADKCSIGTVIVRKKGNNGLFACPCCGYATLQEHSSFEICEICFWQDDGQDDPHSSEKWGGPNHVSLGQARENFMTFGAAEKKSLKFVRAPNEQDELIRAFQH